MKKLFLFSALATIFVANGMNTLDWGGHTGECERLERKDAEAELKKTHKTQTAIFWQTISILNQH